MTLPLSGWGDEDGYNLTNMTDLTGFNFKMNKGTKSSGQITVTNNSADITAGLAGTNFGAQVSTTKYILDEIYVDENTEDMTVLGELSDSGNIGLASKDMGDWTSVYCAAPQLSGEIYRNLLKKADIHIYSEDRSDVITTNGAYVGVHSAASGEKEIYLDGNYAVYDVFEAKYISLNTNVIRYINKVNDTHLFRLTPANTYSFLTMVKGGHGSVSADGLEQLSPGETKTLTFQPDQGYMIKSVIVNGEVVEVPSNNQLTFDNIDENFTIVVRYKRVPVDRLLEEDEETTDEIMDSNAGVDTETSEELGEESTVPALGKIKKIMERWGTEQTVIHLPAWAVILILIILAALIALGIWLVKRWEKKRQDG